MGMEKLTDEEFVEWQKKRLTEIEKTTNKIAGLEVIDKFSSMEIDTMEKAEAFVFAYKKFCQVEEIIREKLKFYLKRTNQVNLKLSSGIIQFVERTDIKIKDEDKLVERLLDEHPEILKTEVDKKKLRELLKDGKYKEFVEIVKSNVFAIK